jgi:hypothetical protein
MTVILALGLFQVVQLFLNYVSGVNGLFFDIIPVRYLFDGADLCILVGFLFLGIYFALKAYRGK